MKAYSYIDRLGINIQFLPTEKVVEETYMNGNKGDALWVQVIGLVVIENYYTEKEIFSLMNNGYQWTTIDIPDMPEWNIGKKCPVCGRVTHHSLCPENIINSDAYQYWACQL